MNNIIKFIFSFIISVTFVFSYGYLSFADEIKSESEKAKQETVQNGDAPKKAELTKEDEEKKKAEDAAAAKAKAEAEAKAKAAAEAKAKAEAEAKAKVEAEAIKKAEEEAKSKAEQAAAAAEKAKQEVSAHKEEESSVNIAWEVMLTSYNAQLAGIISHVDTLESNLAPLRKNISDTFTIMEERYDRLTALSGASGSMPADLTVVAELYIRLRDRIRLTIAPIKSTLEDLDEEMKSMDVLKKSLSSHGSSSISNMNKISETQKKISRLKNSYSAMVSNAEKLEGDVSKSFETLIEKIPALWNQYYFEPSGHFYDIVAWKKELTNLNFIKELFAFRLKTELPNTSSDVFNVFVRIFASIFMLGFVGFMLFSTIRNKIPSTVRPSVEHLFKNSLVWISLGLAIHAGSWVNGMTYPMVMSLGTMFLCWGQMALAWDLYDFQNQAKSRLSPLWPMFPTLFIGMILLNFDPFPVFICVVWVIVQLFDLWRAKVRKLPSQTMPRTIMSLYRVQLWITLFISLYGYSRLSILLNMCYTAISVTFMLCYSMFKVENAMRGKLKQEGSVAVALSLAMALVMPLLLLLCGMAIVLWLLAYPGGYFLLKNVSTMGFSIGSFSLNAIQVLSILIAFYLTRALMAVGNTFMTSMQGQISRISVSLLAPIQIIYKCLLWGVFCLYALNALGFNLSSLSMVAGGLSVGIGIGLQNMVQNFTSGLSVIFGQTIREGDIVDVAGISGTIKKINIRSTMIQTFDNATIFVPNSTFLNNSFSNWTHTNLRIRKVISVGVAYGTDVKKCLDILIKIAKDHPKVLYYPEPSAYFMNFGESSLDLSLRFWVRDYSEGLSVSSDVMLKINEEFAKEGIEISFPQLDIHMRNDSELKISGSTMKEIRQTEEKIEA